MLMKSELEIVGKPAQTLSSKIRFEAFLGDLSILNHSSLSGQRMNVSSGGNGLSDGMGVSSKWALSILVIYPVSSI